MSALPELIPDDIISSSRYRPNILVSGTPGVGKTTLCEELCSVMSPSLYHLEVGELIQQDQLYSEWDEELSCSVFDENRVLEKLEEKMEGGEKVGEGGILVDFHSCWFFPPDWFDLVVVLRNETAVLYERLENKLYRENKITQNIECEIFQVVYDEAMEQFPEDLIVQFNNNTLEELQANVQRIKQWVEEWMAIRRKRRAGSKA
eukprot:GHVS01095553.1.p1 GENE.GHVS01095553.1~~GHVS01095553.1.p1  ORF type:complete len:204 (+),score=48.19 GHVS01095553.1:242-853(+)